LLKKCLPDLTQTDIAKGQPVWASDATMILIGYRHGLRASELCDLQWSQVELPTGRLHVRRAKNGSPSVHPMQGDFLAGGLRMMEFAHPLLTCWHLRYPLPCAPNMVAGS
jgi:integrase